MRRLILTALVVAAPMLGAQRPASGKPLIIVDGVVLDDKAAAAYEQGRPPSGPDDPFSRFFFPPELVMRHQVAIGITDAQRTTLTAAIQQAQAKFVETQFKLSAEGQKLVGLLQNASVDETQTLEQVDRILSMEREVKRAQVGLLVRIKNTLTPAQQAKLMQLRQAKE